MSPRTADSVIDDLGGTGSVAADLDLPLSTVSTWRERGIPPGRWAELVKLARKRRRLHITFEALAESVGRSEAQT
jgi:hypothetical protein